MLDVHAPEHPIGNVREFLLHLFTITCGLLIALGLENAAEAMHHRSERREAETMIRKELTENREALQAGAPEVMGERRAMVEILAFVEARSQGKDAPVPNIKNFTFSEAEIQEAAWRTASSTGVLAYMDYGQVETYAAAYREQELLQVTLQRTLNDFLELSTFVGPGHDPGQLSTQSATEALPYARRTLGDLTGIYAIGVGTVNTYNKALK